MAEMTPKDQLALHEFSVRYRAGYAKSNPLSDLQLETIQDAIRGQYQQEQSAQQAPKPESPTPQKSPEPEEPEM